MKGRSDISGEKPENRGNVYLKKWLKQFNNTVRGKTKFIKCIFLKDHYNLYKEFVKRP